MKTNAKQVNPMANIAEVLTLPSKGTKPVSNTKPSKAITMLSDSDTLQAVNMYAEGIKAGEDSIQTINKALAMFHAKKVKLCKASEKTSPLFAYSNKVRTMFVDSFVALGKKKSYVEKMMYPAFLKGVNSGKELTSINASQENAKAKKAGKKKQVAGIDTIIAKVREHNQFAKLPDDLQDAINDYLESEGYEITE